mmetsp:Transcript_1812/g.1971  ORF Transcript_1812/g.1971 Transcript_1812/m.1971 type:complete len:383 (+) Transcript_1812:115-1263(+)
MGKAKHNRAALAQQGSFSADIKPPAPAASQPEKPPAVSKERLGGVKWDRVGAVVAAQRDYLDMKDIPEENGLKHCGYLVLLRGEEVKLLYVGSESSGDAEWLYGEVVRSLSSEPRGRRGWLPRSVVAPPVQTVPQGPPANRMEARGPGPPPASADPDGFMVVGGQGRRSPGPAASAATPSAGGIARGALQASPQLSASPAERPSAKAKAKATAKTAARASASGRAAAKTQGRSSHSGRGQAAVLSNDAFPALPGHSGTAPWEGDSDDQEEETVEEEEVEKQRDVAGTIARQRAAAAKAAAEAQAAAERASEKRKVKAAAGSKGGDAACPICMQTFNPQRRQITRLCCGTVLCSKCDQKSLQSRRCFFCREEEDEFPSLQRVK